MPRRCVSLKRSAPKELKKRRCRSCKRALSCTSLWVTRRMRQSPSGKTDRVLNKEILENPWGEPQVRERTTNQSNQESMLRQSDCHQAADLIAAGGGAGGASSLASAGTPKVPPYGGSPWGP